jgi:hypothetical protein
VVDPALLILDEEEEGDEDEVTGMELLSEVADDRLALDEEAAAWLSRDDVLAELLGTTEGIEVLTLLILLVTLLSGGSNIRTCLKWQNQSRRQCSGTSSARRLLQMMLTQNWTQRQGWMRMH